MKIRSCFVSNSSSASFTLLKNKMTKSQIEAVCDYIKNPDKNVDGWDIMHENKCVIDLFTVMDNEYMEEFLEKIGVKDSAIINIEDY